GIDTDGVLLAIPFLKSVCFGRPMGIGKNVLVIGGGNVAIDVARTARRLGPESVTMVCLESYDEMPAWDWEVKEAEEEGIKIVPSRGPKSVVVKDGHVAGLEVKECTAVFDAQKRFNPAFNEANVSQIPCDTIIISIGQRGDLGCLKDSGVALNERGQIKFDVATLSTSVPGIFASGEVVTGPGAAIEAVASGHRAATAMDFFMRHGRLTDVPVEKPTALGQIPDETIPKIPKVERAKVPQLAPAERVTHLKEFEGGLSEAAALREARRCMSCALGAVADTGKCASCLTCVRICPFGVAKVDKTAVMSNEKCQACGLCAAECPAMAVKLERFAPEETRGKLQSLVAQLPAKPEPLVAAFCCSLQTTKREQLDTTAEEVARTGIVRLVVPCVARLNVVDILAAFEAGASGACVILCTPGTCRYPNADIRLKQRLDRAKRMLDEVGLGGNRLRLYPGVHGPEKDWPAFTQAFREEVKQLR
ncbi:MAG: hydrogenase iron-sulfur subunit, partial [Planctomycetes bacterium]|nr:hydrogenase iron-sulfur subunit [Planctomycetota bacterium]